jgi:hypothetical protein
MKHPEVSANSHRAGIPVFRLHNINYSNFSFIPGNILDKTQQSVSQ